MRSLEELNELIKIDEETLKEMPELKDKFGKHYDSCFNAVSRDLEDAKIERDKLLNKKEISSLEALLTIDDSYVDNHILDEKYYDLYTQIQTSLKALEIIKKKRVNVDMILQYESVENYNSYCDFTFGDSCEDRNYLTQEEFDIVKKELDK